MRKVAQDSVVRLLLGKTPSCTHMDRMPGGGSCLWVWLEREAGGERRGYKGGGKEFQSTKYGDTFKDEAGGLREHPIPGCHVTRVTGEST